jgi:hypothetical protein
LGYVSLLKSLLQVRIINYCHDQSPN